MRFPTVEEVARCLLEIQARYLNDEGECDVRLQVRGPGSFGETHWQVLWGLSDYDQDHRGHWGCSSVSRDMDKAAVQAVASDLINQARDSFAQEES